MLSDRDRRENALPVAVQRGYGRLPSESVVTRTEFPADSYRRILLSVQKDGDYPAPKFSGVELSEQMKGARAYVHSTVQISEIERLPEHREWNSGEFKGCVPISVTHFSEILPSPRTDYFRLFSREHHGAIPVFAKNREVLEDTRVLICLAMRFSPLSDDGRRLACVTLTLKKVRGNIGYIYHHDVDRKQRYSANRQPLLPQNELIVHTTHDAAKRFFTYMKMTKKAKEEFAQRLFSGQETESLMGLERKSQ